MQSAANLNPDICIGLSLFSNIGELKAPCSAMHELKLCPTTGPGEFLQEISRLDPERKKSNGLSKNFCNTRLKKFHVIPGVKFYS